MAWTPPATIVADQLVDETDWNEQVRDNLSELWHRIAYVEFTADVTITGSEAAPVDMVSAGAVTFTGSNLCVVRFYVPSISWGSAAGGAGVSLWEGTDLGRLVWLVEGTGSGRAAPVVGERYITPSSGSHTYRIRGWANGSGTAQVGAGGAGTKMPGFIEILQRG